MKTFLVLLIALAAAAARAQSMPPDHALATPAATLSAERKTVFKPQEKSYAVHHGRVTYDGAVVEAVNAPRHLEIFNPFDERNFPAPDNTVWQDQPKQKALGWR